ncbi:MAG: O-antigen ligase family protein [Solirubrobacteraceae bacterium]
MTALLQRTGAPAMRWVVLLAAVCGAVGLTAGISPKYGVAVALGLAFVVAVFADLTVGVALFTGLSFLDLLNAGGAAVSLMKVAGLLLFLSWVASKTTAARQTVTIAVQRHPAMVCAIVAFLAWNAVSAVWAESPGQALLTVYRYALVILLIPIMFTAVRERKDVRIIVAAFMIGAAVSAVFGILNPASPTASTAGRLSGGIGDPNEEASVLVAAIVLSVGMASVVKRSPRAALAALAGAIIAFVGLVDTVSRGGLISFACVLVGGVIFGGRWRRQAAMLLVVGTTAVVGYYAILASGSAVHRVTSSDTSGRNDIWTVGWRMFEAHPLNGVGAGNFPVSSVHYLQRPGLVTSAIYIVDTPKVAHNIYLEQLATLGLPGLVLMLGIFVAGIAAALKAARTFERIGDHELELLTRCTILALIAFLSADFFLSNLVSKQLWIVFALGPALLGLAHREAARAARDGT